jgi:hypothetical protein
MIVAKKGLPPYNMINVGNMHDAGLAQFHVMHFKFVVLGVFITHVLNKMFYSLLVNDPEDMRTLEIKRFKIR